MLDTTTSSTELPLVGTMSSSSPSSSFGVGSIKIQRPFTTESYSWCDFPIAMQYDSPTTMELSSEPTITNYKRHDCNGSTNRSNFMYNMETSSSTSSFSSFSSLPSMFTSSSESSISTISTQQQKQQQHQNKIDHRLSSSKRRNSNVRFAPAPFVRTYSLVLGDHPHCEDGLAIELGWEYNEDNDQSRSHTDKRKTIPEQMRTSSTSTGSCQRRSYLSRKQLLLDVAGCTTEELDQRKRDFESKRQRSTDSKIHEEDYYYGLAFAIKR